MGSWTLAVEFFSLIILTVLFLYSYCFEKELRLGFRRKVYLFCLIIAAFSIILNAVCVYTLSLADRCPLWLDMTLNSLYFLVSFLMCSYMAFYLFYLLLEHLYDKTCLRRAIFMLSALSLLSLLLVLWNLRSGILFYFDNSGLYCRGPLNSIGYVFMLLEMVFLLVCYFRNRSCVSSPMKKALLLLPPMILLVSLFQVCYPEVLLNGSIFTLANLILFISFQSHPHERDSLTGIRNRNSFFTELTLRMNGGQSFQIILLGLRSFSDVNQRYGHETGDALLYEVARFLDQLCPQGNAFRYGNVSFSLVLPYTTPAQAQAYLKQVETRFHSSWLIGRQSCSLSLHMTDLIWENMGNTPEALLKYLEYGLKKARKENKVLIRFDDALREDFCRKQEILEIMERSIRENRFQVYYQPLYCCHDNCFCSAEALLRLKDYENLWISPQVFIPLAEEHGLIEPLSWIVLEEICRLLSGGLCPGLQSVSWNLPSQLFMDYELVPHILSCLKRYQLTPDRLKVEITENVLLSDIYLAKQQLAALNEAGISIYMDDFGTGYSNFSGVLDYPFECIKLDRSLIEHILTDRKADMTVRTLMALFHNMGKKLVIEGVETKEQAERLMDYGADQIQGFYYARPVPAEQLQNYFLRCSCRFPENLSI